MKIQPRSGHESRLSSLLEETLEAWWDVREGVIDELRNIPSDKLDFRPSSEMRSVREPVQHILEVAMMMTRELRLMGLVPALTQRIQGG